jgi:lysyl-tRNA synthetase class 2
MNSMPGGCRIPVESSVLASILYIAEERLLDVEFRSGRRYLYSDVSPSRVDELLATQSKGRYFNARIRNCFPASELKQATR